MRAAWSVLFLAVVLGACGLSAGAQGHLFPAAGCPQISLRPNLDGGQFLPSSSKAPRRSVTVTLGGSGDEAVMAADITLLGVESPAGTYPVTAAKPMRVPFHVVQPAGANGPLVVALALPSAMTSINGATVDAVSFRSGQRWEAAEPSSCTVHVGTALLASR